MQPNKENMPPLGNQSATPQRNAPELEWLRPWPIEYQELTKTICEQFDYDALHLIEDVSGKGGRTFLAAPEGKHGIPCGLALKFGEIAQLRDELSKAEEAVNHFSQCNYVRQLIKSSGGLGCIVMELAGSGTPKTFAAFFRSSSAIEIEALIEKLFTSTLRAPYLNVLQTPKNACACHILDNLEQLRRDLLSLRPRAAVLFDWWLEVSKRDRSSSCMAFCHGDLHGKNIIVTQTQGGWEPRIIDFGRTGQRHIFYNYAKLERDIALRIFISTSRNPTDEIQRLYPKLPDASSIAPQDTQFLKVIGAIETIRKIAREVALPGAVDWNKEYLTAVFAQFLFAAANPQADFGQQDNKQTELLRKAALKVCEVLRPTIQPTLGTSGRVGFDPSTVVREQVLWRLACAFLRLDQLPWGGWSRTLASWMEAIWEGDKGMTPKNPNMHTQGGADQTSLALYHYADLVRRLIPPHERFFLVGRNYVFDRAIAVMRQMMTERGILTGFARLAGQKNKCIRKSGIQPRQWQLC
jgi:hypothetical protein